MYLAPYLCLLKKKRGKREESAGINHSHWYMYKREARGMCSASLSYFVRYRLHLMRSIRINSTYVQLKIVIIKDSDGKLHCLEVKLN